MTGKLNKLRILSFVSCVVMLPAFLCGCGESEKESTHRADKTDRTDRGPEAYLEQGDGHFRVGRHEEAIIAYKKAIALKPDFADAYLALGNAYEILGKDEDAIAAFKKYIAIKPTNPMADYVRGLINELSKEPGKRMSELSKEDMNAVVYLAQGSDHSREGRYEEAVAAYKKCIALRPNFSMAYCFMGSAYFNLKQYPEAIAAFEKTIALQPTGELADMARKQLSEIENRDKP